MTAPAVLPEGGMDFDLAVSHLSSRTILEQAIEKSGGNKTLAADLLRTLKQNHAARQTSHTRNAEQRSHPQVGITMTRPGGRYSTCPSARKCTFSRRSTSLRGTPNARAMVSGLSPRRLMRSAWPLLFRLIAGPSAGVAGGG